MAQDSKQISGGLHRATIAHYDEDGDTLHIEEKFDVEPAIIEAARMSDTRPGDTFRQIGEVPMWAVHKAMREGWYHDQTAWRKFLREHPVFKVHKM